MESLPALRRALLRLVAFFRSGRADAELAREIRTHLQLLEDQFVARGMSPAEARYAAMRRFGGVEQAKQHQRDARSFRWLDNSWLDFKLGTRMLIKYPALTLIGGLGIAVAVAIGALSFTFFYSYLFPTLPLHEGDRIVGIQNWDEAESRDQPRSLHDFVTWRDELSSMEDVGAFRLTSRNLIVANGVAEPTSLAAITAAGFRITRVPPLMGRPIIEDDERKGAPAVAVIGHELWRTRFASDPAIVGQTIRLGDTVHTIVGVMPEGYGFPVNHRLWVPLQLDPSDFPRGQSPAIDVFGRLAPGFSVEAAHAELATIGHRAAAAFPETNQHLRPRIVPYSTLWFGEAEMWQVHLIQFLITMLLVVVCVNVAVLVYARTVTRHGEMVVRSALGASRLRIVGQLFMEALVLSMGAALAGLVIARVALDQLIDFIRRQAGGVPFWIGAGLSLDTLAFVVGLAVLGALIAGAVPGWKATGQRLEAGLRQLGGATNLQLGRTFTVLIVAQVAFSVALLPAAIAWGWKSIKYGNADPGFAAEEVLSARLTIDQDTPPSAEAEAYRRAIAARYGDRLTELVTRLEAEPGIADVTFASVIPGQEPTAWVVIDGVAPPSGPEADYTVESGTRAGHQIRFGRVGTGFFEAFKVPTLTGRSLQAGDVSAAPTAVIVNRTFAEQLLGGNNPIGRRLRYAGTSGDARPGEVELDRWHEIVGVVPDFPATPIEPGMAEAKVYHPVAPEQVFPATLAMRIRGTTQVAAAGRLREITTALDPTLRLSNILPMDQVYSQARMPLHSLAIAVGLVTLSVVLLSAAGIYALMSFTVARRSREIGIRAALGADPRRLLVAIFSRALVQLAIGIVAGLTVAGLIDRLSSGELMFGEQAIIVPLVAAIMMAVGLLAVAGPARHGLRIHPTDALREE
jgi:putative ABC transport system permease protein